MKRITRIISVVVAIAGTWAVPVVQGQAIGNASFESPDVASQGGTFHTIEDPATTGSQPWTFLGHSGILDNTTPGAEATSAGTQSAWMVLNGTVGGSFSQPIVFSTAGTFKLSYLEGGDIPTGTGDTGDLIYRILLQLGTNTPILSVTDSTTSRQAFLLTSYNFTVPAAGTYNLSFATVSHGGTNSFDEAFIDSVAIGSVPEPSTAWFLVAGAGFLVFFRPSRCKFPLLG